MLRVLVTDSLGQEGLAFLAAQDDVETDIRVGLKQAELAEAVRTADALIVRSGTQVTAEVLEEPGQLRVVARAGVGVDNIELDAATRAGVLVMNTPDANTISTAELTMAHILALSRNLVAACNSTKAGGWERKRFSGAQLAGKTIGIAGFGRVGRAVARRALTMEMRVLVHDPYYAGSGAPEVEFCGSIDDMMPRLDVLTVHTPLTDQTTGMIGAAQFALAKPGLLVVNCARGGIIDEPALAEAIRSGKVAGAGIDTFATEPPGESELLKLDEVIVTPHLGASTAEAQAGVAMEACEAVLAYLRDGDVRGAVNIAGVDFQLDANGKRLADLAQRMGAMLSVLSMGPLRRLKVTLYGQRAQAAGMACARYMMVELLRPHLNHRVNVVNVMEIARERDLAVEVIQVPDSRHVEDQIEAHVSSDEEHSIAGSVVYNNLPHVWQIDGYRMDMIPAGQMVLLSNADRPGVIGVVGAIFGNAGVNIADMTISRQGPRAMMVLRVDGEIGDDLLHMLADAEPVLWVCSVELPAAPGER